MTRVNVKNKGFCFATELAVLRDYDYGYLGVGAKFAYWSRFSASAGFGFYDFNRPCFKPYVSVDYNIPYFKNTSIGVNYNFNNVDIKLSV
ncbi:hypothetical protein AGMMS49990_05520 [Endomicrobiia bacterium]|nr:hypothetical protein AGMMS49990_05520 [Endomicrobiia bacterium]